MPLRDIYLRIETIPGYSPVEPDDHVSPPIQYRRDCVRNMGHEDGSIPDDEVAARRLTALIYREYLDPQYLIPKPDKLVAADVNARAVIQTPPGVVTSNSSISRSDLNKPSPPIASRSRTLFLPPWPAREVGVERLEAASAKYGVHVAGTQQEPA